MPRRPRGLRKAKKGPKAKAVAFELINPDQKVLPEPYKLLKEVRKDYHPDTIDAKIALAWHKNVKPDVDGRLMLGRCHKASDLQRELVEWDFVIELNWEAWNNEKFTVEKKKALLDHEMMHAAVSLTKDSDPKVDERGRAVYRIRAHDLEEFRDVVARHGCYKADLEAFAEALLKKQGNLFAKPEEKPAATVN